MPTFLYSFGYESPRQFQNNASHGGDDEDSQGLLIDSPDESAALAWGQLISEQFLKLLFRDDSVSWSDRRYAHWIELPAEAWVGQQHVSVGEFPDFTQSLHSYENEM